MEFTKMHGLGNDFIIVDNLNYRVPYEYFARIAPLLCRRHFGIGADGLVILDYHSKAALFTMRIFNPDGSEAEMCGNAIRCLARYVWEKGLNTNSTFSFLTRAGKKEISLTFSGNEVRGVKVDMGEPVLDSKEIPVTGSQRRVIEEKISAEGEELYFTAVSMGNPHCVIFVPGVEEIPWQRWGPVLEESPVFPRKTNVEFVQVLNPREVKVKVWERGAGPTLACGTGACAVLAAGVITGRLENKAKVKLPGGALQISWEEDNRIFMEGPAEEVFVGKYRGELPGYD